MNLLPFYELRDRLYASAAAGCSAAGEDFRLKRAVDAFEPLANASKVFGRLYTLCGKLFTEEAPAPLLAECIALADAAAVAQGAYGDDCATLTSELSLPASGSNNFAYSAVSALCEKIEKHSSVLGLLSAEDIELIGDSRVLAEFIQTCKRGGGEYLDGFADKMFAYYGSALVQPLKNLIDLCDPKASGTAVKYVCELAGKAENDWYTALAENDEAPQNVRTAAIKALGNDDRAKDELLLLFKTRKGKIRNAALEALAGIDCPETEEILEKLTQKYSASYSVYIALSGGKVCTDFVLDTIRERYGGDSPRESGGRIDDCTGLLANKPNADEGFLILAKNGYGDALSRVLILNLRNRNSEPFKELIHRLYKEDPDAFYKAEFFMRLIDEPENAVAAMGKLARKYRSEMLTILRGIYYNAADGQYCTDWRAASLYVRRPELRLFEEYPQSLLDFICGDNGGAALLELLNTCRPEDLERLKESAKKFVFGLARKCPDADIVEIVSQHYREEKPSEYKGLISRYVLNRINNGKYSVSVPVRGIDTLPLTEADKLAEMNALIKKVQSLKGKISDSVYNGQMRYITQYLNNSGNF